MDLDQDDGTRIVGDVYSFIETKVNELCRAKHLDKDFQVEILSFLQDNSQGSLLWVGLVILELRELRNRLQLRNAMKAIPSGLPELYARLLRRIKEKSPDLVKHAGFLLRCVAIVKKPLTIKSWATLMVPDAIVAGEELILALIEISGGVLQIHKRENDSSYVVNLVHQSARDYLVTNSDPELQEFWFIEEDTHYELANRCLAYLERVYASIRRKSAFPPEGWHFQPEDFPTEEVNLVYYALEFWNHHACHCGIQARKMFNLERPFFANDASVRKFWNYVGFGASPPESVGALDLSQLNFIWFQDQLSEVHIAALLGNVPWLESLLEESIPAPSYPSPLVDNEDYFSVTPLQYAALGGHEKAVEGLITKHLASRAQSGRALWFATISGSSRIASLLIRHHGVDVNIHMENQQDLLDLAFLGDEDPIVFGDRGTNYPKQITPRPISLLTKAIGECYIELVRVLLDAGAILWPLGISVIREAARYSEQSILELLIARGAKRDADGRTALYHALVQNDQETLRILVENRALMEGWDGVEGFRPFEVLRADPGIHVLDNHGKNALYWASAGGNSEAVSFLLSLGLQMDISSCDWDSPLFSMPDALHAAM